MIEVKAPNEYRIDAGQPILFTAGSIEMGAAVDWQKRLIEELKDTDTLILNPRRDDWDSSWEQSINNHQFKEQVMWELNGLDHADVVAMYFAPGTKSPISLLELGILTNSYDNNRTVVYCPAGFWRKGNVDIVCEWYELPYTDDYDQWIVMIKYALENT